MRLQSYCHPQLHHLKDKFELIVKIYSWTTWNWKFLIYRNVTFIWFNLIIYVSQTPWDDTEKSNREDFKILLKQKIFFYYYSPPWCGQSYGGKARTQERNIWMEQEESIFLWSCDKLANGTSRVRDQKRLFFLSHPTALCPPLLLSRCPIPIHLFRVWLVSCGGVMLHHLEFPRIFSGFHKIFILQPALWLFQDSQDSDCRTELGTVLARRRKPQSWSHQRNGNNLNVHQLSKLNSPSVMLCSI